MYICKTTCRCMQGVIVASWGIDRAIKQLYIDFFVSLYCTICLLMVSIEKLQCKYHITRFTKNIPTYKGCYLDLDILQLLHILYIFSYFKILLDDKNFKFLTGNRLISLPASYNYFIWQWYARWIIPIYTIPCQYTNNGDMSLTK